MALHAVFDSAVHGVNTPPINSEIVHLIIQFLKKQQEVIHYTFSCGGRITVYISAQHIFALMRIGQSFKYHSYTGVIKTSARNKGFILNQPEYARFRISSLPVRSNRSYLDEAKTKVSQLIIYLSSLI